jgi:hypothetical protein
MVNTRQILGILAMRFLLGIIVGIGFTIGGAYVYDSFAARGTPEASARPMVNWDVVDNNWDRATTRVRKEWDKLAAK